MYLRCGASVIRTDGRLWPSPGLEHEKSAMHRRDDMALFALAQACAGGKPL